MKPVVLFSYAALPTIRSHADKELQCHFPEKDLSNEELIALAQKTLPQGLILTMRNKVTEEFLNQLPMSVKVIATTSVGTDHFDIPAAQSKGIVLTNTPDVLTDCTADMAMLLLLNASRRSKEYVEIMEEGWRKTFSQSDMLGLNLRGKSLGIFGMGRIGQALADRARTFGMKILYNNRRQLAPEFEKGATYFSSFEDMIPHCDVLSLNAPSTPETVNIMTDEKFAMMRDKSIFINVARGNMVDEAALIRALESKKLFAVGLDVFHNEPSFNVKIQEFPNAFLTPHMGSATEETRSAMGILCVDNVSSVLRGEGPLTAVT